MMEEKEIKEIAEKHAKWLKGEPGGEKYICPIGANLIGANLIGANLRRADLSSADLSGANLSSANLIGANLRRADLSGANLSSADLSGANLSSADLSSADLSGSKGIAVAKTYLSQFEIDKKGIIVYKVIGNTFYNAPDHWDIKKNAFLEETVNPLRTMDCGSVVNFATLEWIKKAFKDRDTTIWKCRILWEDLADVVVPYNTDGKARCARLQLIEPLKKGE
jgi:hypothetical protein